MYPSDTLCLYFSLQWILVNYLGGFFIMEMTLLPDRLIRIREARGLNKAEASRLLGLSKMGYLRYETAVRTPSYQTLVFIAQKLRTSPEYLAGLTDDPSPRELLISRDSDPELFDILIDIADKKSKARDRLLAYYREIADGSEVQE